MVNFSQSLIKKDQLRTTFEFVALLKVISILGSLIIYTQIVSGTAASILPDDVNSSDTNNKKLIFLTYENPSLNISIDYPASWHTAEHFFRGTSVVEFVIPPEANSTVFPGIVSTVIQQLSNNTLTLDDYTEKVNKLLQRSFVGANISQSIGKSTTLGGFPAQERVYVLKYNMTGLEIKAKQVFSLNDNKAYTITYAAVAGKYDTYLPIVQKIVSSFQATSKENASTTRLIAANQTSVVADLEAAKARYLSAWNNTNFHSAFDTFVEKDSVRGYGIYKELQLSPILESGKGDLNLYVEPVGFEYQPILGEGGKTVYRTNFTANILVFDKERKQVQSLLIPLSEDKVYFHNRSTEQYLLVPFYQQFPLPEGEYKIRFFITDGNSGESFQIEKNFRVAEVLQVG